MLQKTLLRVVGAVLVVASVGCGRSPVGPSTDGAVLHGVAVQSGVASAMGAGQTVALAESGRHITVRVQEKIEIQTTIAINGTFELEDLPLGTFHLEFVDDSGTVVGTVTITQVQPGSEVDLEVDGVAQDEDHEHGHDDDDDDD